MNIAEAAAPDIDRLVWSVNGAIGPAHGDDIDRLAEQQGLDSTDLLFHLGDFLLAGILTSGVAVLRLRYAPPVTVLERLDYLQANGFIKLANTGLVATEALRPVLHAMYDARDNAAAELWQGHEPDVDVASSLAREVAMAASNDHVVAAGHRELPEPNDPYGRLHHRLVTLRYVRQHDHAAAWHAAGLTPGSMAVMTALWHGETPDVSSGIPQVLVEREYVTDGPVQLTALGRQVREDIEVDTNRRAQESFEVLQSRGKELIEALRALPGSPD